MTRIAEGRSAEKRRHGPDTILVVEDETLMLSLLEQFFSHRGYHVLAASDGEQAIEIYRCYQPRIDAVLLDMRLPKLPGEEVFRRMKAENAAVKVVMASGYLEPNVKRDMTLQGVKGFVVKPYELPELLEVFQKVISE